MEKIRFRWSYLALPLALLVIAVVSAAVFYGKLPLQTGYRFSGGAAVNEAARGVILGWSLGLQVVFVLIAAVIVFLIISLGRKLNLAPNNLNNTMVRIMGNMLVIPQIIVYYATLDIFLYNIYDKALPALWAFGLLVLFVGAIVIAGVFFKAFLQSRTAKT